MPLILHFEIRDTVCSRARCEMHYKMQMQLSPVLALMVAQVPGCMHMVAHLLILAGCTRISREFSIDLIIMGKRLKSSADL